MGNSFGCSASGERLVSAARDGDLQEAQALLDCNPRLAKYSTFGVRNSPLHFSAMQGHNEIVTLLLECGVEVNTRNYCGQTALMQACRYGHWEVVQTLLLYRANVNRADYLNGRTALHFAAVSGHARCMRLIVADYVPSVPYLWNTLQQPVNSDELASMKNHPDQSSLARVVNRAADGGITSLHMAALNSHAECVQLLLDLCANVNAVTIQDGTTIDLIGNLQPGSLVLKSEHLGSMSFLSDLERAILDFQLSSLLNNSRSVVRQETFLYLIMFVFCPRIANYDSCKSGPVWYLTKKGITGAGSTPLHYAACGGSIPCCQALIAKGASRSATNCNGWTALQVARLWRRYWLEPLLSPDSSIPIQPFPPSRYLALPLSSIMKIARDCGWRSVDPAPVDADPCSVCLERRCTVAAEGCGHELCTRCALYLCSTNIVATTTSSPPGAIPCPLCRHGIISFVKLPTTMSLKDLAKVNSTSLTLCTTCTMEISEPNSARSLLQKSENRGGCRVSPLSTHSLRLTCPGFSSLNCPGGFGSNDEENGCTSPAVTCGFARSDSRSEVRTGDSTTIETLAWPAPSRASMLITAPVVAVNPSPVQPHNDDIEVPSSSKPTPTRDFGSPKKVPTMRWLRKPFRWSNYASLRSHKD